VSRLRPVVIVLLVLMWLVVAVRPSWQAVRDSSSGRDYATYHYAVQEALDGGDPYETPALVGRARLEGTRRGLNPFFYPPPFLLGMVWAAPLSLEQGYRAWFWMNQGALLAVALVMWRWFRVSPLALAFIAATFTPIPDNAKMGQANLMVLLLAMLGLWRTRGSLLGAAAMAKMSPAAYLGWWVVRRSWRPVLLAVATAVGLSLLSLLIVPLSAQVRFYTEILPGFASGDYHGLRVPIDLPANHSIPDLFNQLWPGPDRHTLSAAAQRASSLVSLALLAGVCALGLRRRDPLGEALIAGAFTVVLLITPVYAYEHHLVFLLLPLGAVAAAVQRGRLSRWWWPPLALAYAGVAWPLYWLRPAGRALPALAWVFQESKFFGAAALLVACAWAAWRSPRVEAPAPVRSPRAGEPRPLAGRPGRR